MAVFEKWLLRRIYRPKREETVGYWKTQVRLVEPFEKSLLF